MTPELVAIVLGVIVLVTFVRLGLRLLFFLASLVTVIVAAAWLAGYPPDQVLAALRLP